MAATPTDVPRRAARWLAPALAALIACDGPVDPFPVDLPPGFPTPLVPDDNPFTPEKAELGRHLFFDVRLSGNGTQSCGSCHDPALAFTDGLATPVGSTGEHVPRNAMSLANVAWMETLTWANPVLHTLEKQALVPLFADRPIELGAAPHEAAILDRLRAEPRYTPLFAGAFPGEADPYATANVVAALATFERSLISGASPYDRWAYGGEPDALSPLAQEGFEVFHGEVAECYHCHPAPLFTTAVATVEQPVAEPSYHNTGLYDLDGAGAYPEPNTGLHAVTGRSRDMGRFRVPSLRNVAVTAPYFHDGSAPTLRDVLDHYMAGGRVSEAGGDGTQSPLKHPLVRAFQLTPREQDAVLAFLDALTDEGFLTDPAHADPWR